MTFRAGQSLFWGPVLSVAGCWAAHPQLWHGQASEVGGAGRRLPWLKTALRAVSVPRGPGGCSLPEKACRRPAQQQGQARLVGQGPRSSFLLHVCPMSMGANFTRNMGRRCGHPATIIPTGNLWDASACSPTTLQWRHSRSEHAEPAGTCHRQKMGNQAVELDSFYLVKLQYKRKGKLPECFSNSTCREQIHFEAYTYIYIFFFLISKDICLCVCCGGGVGGVHCTKGGKQGLQSGGKPE